MEHRNTHRLVAAIFPFCFGNAVDNLNHQKIKERNIAIANGVHSELRELSLECGQRHRVRNHIEEFAFLVDREESLCERDLLVYSPSIKLALEGAAIGGVIARNRLSTLFLQP